MDAQAAPLSVLTERLRLIGSDSEESEQVDAVSKVLRESQDAERVELSTRVLAAVPSSEEAEALEQEAARSVKWLVEEGNPTSQVKMLRLVDRLPDQDARDVVEKTMESKVSWVRDQALEVAANISESVSASPLPIEVVNAYADGSILRKIGSRLRLAKKIKSKGLAVVSVISFVLFLLQMFVVGAVVQEWACSISYVVYSDYSYWEWGFRLVLVAVLLALVGSVIWSPVNHWIIIPTVGFGILFCIVTVYILWCYAPDATLSDIVIGIVAVPPIVLFLIAFLGSIWFLVVVVIEFLFATMLALSILIWTRRVKYFFSCYLSIVPLNYLIISARIMWGDLSELICNPLMVTRFFKKKRIKDAPGEIFSNFWKILELAIAIALLALIAVYYGLTLGAKLVIDHFRLDDYSGSWLINVIIVLLTSVLIFFLFIVLRGLTQEIGRKYAARKNIKLYGINKSQFESVILDYQVFKG
ncbi:MAG: hypothetical protein SD837_14540 [Candidatus Electrothrix scaldis]|nr:MAG: hypothetical protein SD837_14540 [Candidatus Electrothrix sp. GW3-3]